MLAHPEHAIPEKALDILPTTKYLVILKKLCSSLFPILWRDDIIYIEHYDMIDAVIEDSIKLLPMKVQH